jgi:hypothetical protein
MNSVIISFGSTLLGLIIAVPAAWAMAFSPTKRTKDVLMWMLSTKMMPPVGALIPIYLMFRNTGLLDSRLGLVMVLTLINLPIIVWMLYTYFKEIPGEILEAARMDGASLEGDHLRADADGGAGHCLDAAPQHHPGLERSLLDAQPHRFESGAADGVHRLLFQPGRPVLRQAFGRIDHGDRPDPDPRLVQPETTRPRPDLRRGEIRT